MINKDKVIKVIYKALDEINEQLPKEKRLTKSPETQIFGNGQGLDSLGFVNFIVAIEQGIEKDFGVNVVMAENEEMLDFNTVEGLADRLNDLLEKRSHG